MDQRAMELLEHRLRDMYDAEQRFVRTLGTMEEHTKDTSLTAGFRRHKDVTENQVKRIEDAFREIGQEPATEPCRGAAGLIEEYESFLEDHVEGDGLLDAFSATAGLKVEHYEIASYRTLVDLAEFCDQREVADLLRKNLAEEEQAAAEMMSASMRLGAKLAGAPAHKVATRSVGGMFDHAREGALGAVGGAKAVAGRAGDTLDRLERRGRRSRTKAKRSTSTARRKTTSAARRTTGTARRKASSAKRKTASTAKRKTRTSPARKRSAASRKKPARKTKTARGRTTSRRPTGRGSVRRTTARKSSTRRGTSSR